MMRITDILYTIPDILLIIILAMALRDRLDSLAEVPGFRWMQTVGPNLVAIFLVFVLLYWVGMARITRSQAVSYTHLAASSRRAAATSMSAPIPLRTAR